MNSKRLFLFTLVFVFLASAMLSAAPATRERALRPLLQHLKFGLQMIENNLFEARMILRFKAEIGLNAEQVKKIEDMMLAQEEQGIRRDADIKVLEVKFAALMREPKVNRKEMEKMLRQLGQLRTDLQVDHMNYLLDVRGTLTAEQIAKLDGFKRKFRDGMRERLGGGNHMQPNAHGNHAAGMGIPNMPTTENHSPEDDA